MRLTAIASVTAALTTTGTGTTHSTAAAATCTMLTAIAIRTEGLTEMRCAGTLSPPVSVPIMARFLPPGGDGPDQRDRRHDPRKRTNGRHPAPRPRPGAGAVPGIPQAHGRGAGDLPGPGWGDLHAVGAAHAARARVPLPRPA